MNNYPILAPQYTWFAPNNSTVTRAGIIEIEIMDSYIPDSSVTVVDSWDASAVQDGSITCYVIGTKLIIAGNGSGKIAMNEDSQSWFKYNTEDWSEYDIPQNVERITGLSFFDTSNVHNFSGMFNYFFKITELDLSTFNTSSATDMSSMFASCDSLSSLNISNWDTNKVTTMKSMFGNCHSLEYVHGLDELDTSNVTDMGWMFQSSKITNFTNLNTSKVTSMQYMFLNYLRETFVFPEWDLSNVLNFSGCFAGGPEGGTVKTLDLTNFKHNDQVNLSHLFTSLATVNTIILPSDFCKGVQDLSNLFRGLNRIKYLDLKNLNTSHATSLRNMFSDCSALTGIDVSNWDVSNVTDMSFMFYACSSLKEIDVSKWDVSKVENFDHFAAHALLRRKGIENWNTSSATNMNAMFHNCAEEELDLSGFDTSKVQFFSQMFENSPNLKHIKGLDRWDTSNATGFDEMFGRCPKLEELDLSSWDTSKAKNGVQASLNGHTTGTFRNFCNDCVNLKWIKLGPDFAVNGDGTNTNAAYKLILPVPAVENADGLWRTFNGNTYKPNAIPDRTANTYYASEDLIRSLTVRVNNGSLLDIVAAVRERVPDLAPTLLSDIDDVIKNI